MRLRNSLFVLLFGGTLGFWLLREQQRGALEPFDRVHREFLKANPAAGQRSAPDAPAVVLVRLDDVDQANRVFSAWPLVGGDWHIILQNLSGYAPQAVAIAAPLLFGSATGGLEAAARGIQGLSVGVAASAAAGEGALALPDSLPALKVSGRTLAIPEFKSIRQPAMAGSPGVVEIDLLPRSKWLTVEGDWCRVPMLARMGDKVVPTLALRSLLEWALVPPQDVFVQTGVAITAGKRLRIEIDEAGFFRYFLSLAPVVPSVNADIFVLSREQAVSSLAPDDPQRKVLAGLKNSLLWFGPDDAAARQFRLPNGTPVSPAELTARALAAIQTNSYMRPLPPSRQWMPPAATLLFCMWLSHWRKSRLWPGALAAAAVLAATSLYLYHAGHWWMPLVPSLALLAATVVLAYVLPAPARRSPAARERPSSVKTAPALVAASPKQPSGTPAPTRAVPASPPDSPEPGPPAPAPGGNRKKKKRR
jgi:hypothetical protein